jgi:hypothetical protein
VAEHTGRRAGGVWLSIRCRFPFDYISTQDVAKDADLNKKYDVIIFGPGNGNVNG